MLIVFNGYVERFMELNNTEQLSQAKARLSSSMKGLEEAVNARVSVIKARVINEAQQASEGNVAESQQLVQGLQTDVAVLQNKNQELKDTLAKHEASYNALKVMSEQSVDVLEVAIAKLDACNSGE